jgi:cyanoexosortase A
MKGNSFLSSKLFQRPHFWLLSSAAGFATLQLTLTWKAGETDHLGMSVLFWLATASLLQEKQDRLVFKFEWFAGALGILLLAGVLFYSTSLPGEGDPFLRLAPIVSALGLGLIASGYRGVRQYWQELTVLFFLGAPRVLAGSWFDPSPITAKFAAFMLWYTGFDVSSQGTYVILPTGSVRVYAGCSGLESMAYLLGLAVIFLMMFSTTRFQKALVIFTSIAIAFVVNSLRVALMAILVATSSPEAFDYWHEGDGSMIFAVAAVLTFGSFCFGLLKWQQFLQEKAEAKKSRSPHSTFPEDPIDFFGN